MGHGKCYFVFGCGRMKFFLVLLCLLLLFDSPQGSSISHKRTIRGLNTTLQANFNGTYEKRNSCTNAAIETTSYIASHELYHYTKENNWSDYASKCSAIIKSFLQAIGNLAHFNKEQNGVFNFHLNTSISQKQDFSKLDSRKSCGPLPTITIEATGCEISPKSPCKSESVKDEAEQFESNTKKAIQEKRYPFSQDEPQEEKNRAPTPKPDTTETSQLLRTIKTATAEDFPLRNSNDFPKNLKYTFENEENVNSFETSTKPEYSFDQPNHYKKTFIPRPEGEFPTTWTDEFNPTEYESVFPTTTQPNLSKSFFTFPENSDTKTSTSETSEIDQIDLLTTPPYYSSQTPITGIGSASQSTPPVNDEDKLITTQYQSDRYDEQQPVAHSEQLFIDDLKKEVPDSPLLSQNPVNSFSPSDQTPTPKVLFLPSDQTDLKDKIFDNRNLSTASPKPSFPLSDGEMIANQYLFPEGFQPAESLPYKEQLLRSNSFRTPPTDISPSKSPGNVKEYLSTRKPSILESNQEYFTTPTDVSAQSQKSQNQKPSRNNLSNNDLSTLQIPISLPDTTKTDNFFNYPNPVKMTTLEPSKSYTSEEYNVASIRQTATEKPSLREGQRSLDSESLTPTVEFPMGNTASAIEIQRKSSRELPVEIHTKQDNDEIGSPATPKVNDFSGVYKIPSESSVNADLSSSKPRPAYSVTTTSIPFYGSTYMSYKNQPILPSNLISNIRSSKLSDKYNHNPESLESGRILFHNPRQEPTVSEGLPFADETDTTVPYYDDHIVNTDTTSIPIISNPYSEEATSVNNSPKKQTTNNYQEQMQLNNQDESFDTRSGKLPFEQTNNQPEKLFLPLNKKLSNSNNFSTSKEYKESFDSSEMFPNENNNDDFLMNSKNSNTALPGSDEEVDSTINNLNFRNKFNSYGKVNSPLNTFKPEISLPQSTTDIFSSEFSSSDESFPETTQSLQTDVTESEPFHSEEPNTRLSQPPKLISNKFNEDELYTDTPPSKIKAEIFGPQTSYSGKLYTKTLLSSPPQTPTDIIEPDSTYPKKSYTKAPQPLQFTEDFSDSEISHFDELYNGTPPPTLRITKMLDIDSPYSKNPLTKFNTYNAGSQSPYTEELSTGEDIILNSKSPQITESYSKKTPETKTNNFNSQRYKSTKTYFKAPLTQTISDEPLTRPPTPLQSTSSEFDSETYIDEPVTRPPRPLESTSNEFDSETYIDEPVTRPPRPLESTSNEFDSETYINEPVTRPPRPLESTSNEFDSETYIDEPVTRPPRPLESTSNEFDSETYIDEPVTRPPRPLESTSNEFDSETYIDEPVTRPSRPLQSTSSEFDSETYIDEPVTRPPRPLESASSEFDSETYINEPVTRPPRPLESTSNEFDSETYIDEPVTRPPRPLESTSYEFDSEATFSDEPLTRAPPPFQSTCGRYSTDWRNPKKLYTKSVPAQFSTNILDSQMSYSDEAYNKITSPQSITDIVDKKSSYVEGSYTKAPNSLSKEFLDDSRYLDTEEQSQAEPAVTSPTPFATFSDSAKRFVGGSETFHTDEPFTQVASFVTNMNKQSPSSSDYLTGISDNNEDIKATKSFYVSPAELKLKSISWNDFRALTTPPTQQQNSFIEDTNQNTTPYDPHPDIQQKYRNLKYFDQLSNLGSESSTASYFSSNRQGPFVTEVPPLEQTTIDSVMTTFTPNDPHIPSEKEKIEVASFEENFPPQTEPHITKKNNEEIITTEYQTSSSTTPQLQNFLKDEKDNFQLLVKDESTRQANNKNTPINSGRSPLSTTASLAPSLDLVRDGKNLNYKPSGTLQSFSAQLETSTYAPEQISEIYNSNMYPQTTPFFSPQYKTEREEIKETESTQTPLQSPVSTAELPIYQALPQNQKPEAGQTDAIHKPKKYLNDEIPSGVLSTLEPEIPPSLSPPRDASFIPYDDRSLSMHSAEPNIPHSETSTSTKSAPQTFASQSVPNGYLNKLENYNSEISVDKHLRNEFNRQNFSNPYQTFHNYRTGTPQIRPEFYRYFDQNLPNKRFPSDSAINYSKFYGPLNAPSEPNRDGVLRDSHLFQGSSFPYGPKPDYMGRPPLNPSYYPPYYGTNPFPPYYATNPYGPGPGPEFYERFPGPYNQNPESFFPPPQTRPMYYPSHINGDSRQFQSYFPYGPHSPVLGRLHETESRDIAPFKDRSKNESELILNEKQNGPLRAPFQNTEPYFLSRKLESNFSENFLNSYPEQTQRFDTLNHQQPSSFALNRDNLLKVKNTEERIPLYFPPGVTNSQTQSASGDKPLINRNSWTDFSRQPFINENYGDSEHEISRLPFTSNSRQLPHNSFYPLSQYPMNINAQQAERFPPEPSLIDNYGTRNSNYSFNDQVLSSQSINKKLLDYNGRNPGNTMTTLSDSQFFDRQRTDQDYQTRLQDRLPNQRQLNLESNQQFVPLDYQTKLPQEPGMLPPNSEPTSLSPPGPSESNLSSPPQILKTKNPLDESSKLQEPTFAESFDPKRVSSFSRGSDSLPFESQKQNESHVVSHPQPDAGDNASQSAMNTSQHDSHALVFDLTAPSNKPGENNVSCCELCKSKSIQIPLLRPFDPVLKGNMTAPSYYLLVSKLPVGDDKEERFKVEKVNLIDGTPLNYTFISGKTFPTSLHTPIQYSETDHTTSGRFISLASTSEKPFYEDRMGSVSTPERF